MTSNLEGSQHWTTYCNKRKETVIRQEFMNFIERIERGVDIEIGDILLLAGLRHEQS